MFWLFKEEGDLDTSKDTHPLNPPPQGRGHKRQTHRTGGGIKTPPKAQAQAQISQNKPKSSLNSNKYKPTPNIYPPPSPLRKGGGNKFGSRQLKRIISYHF